MAKELSGSYEEIWFDIDIFKIDKDGDIDDQIHKAVNDDRDYHFTNDCFETYSLGDAVLTAKRLLARDWDYNLALITLNRYTHWGEEDEKCEDSVVVGEIWAEEIEES